MDSRTFRFHAPGWLVVLVCILVAGCAGRMPTALADGSGRFAPCPASPNCVSSDAPASDAVHAIAPLVLRGSADAAFAALGEHLRATERVDVVVAETGYVQAVFTTPLMRYRDDVEFALEREQGRIRVRSASRVGYGDMGLNRERIESIRAALAERGLVEAAVAAGSVAGSVETKAD